MVNNILPTLCSFKLRGAKPIAEKHWFVGEKLSIEIATDSKLAVFDSSNSICGWLPYFLNDLLMQTLHGSPDGKFYCEVDRVFNYDRTFEDNIYGKVSYETVSVSCKLSENPAIPDILRGEVSLAVYAHYVKGIRNKPERIVNSAMCMDGVFPSIALQRERTNPVDASAILIFAIDNGKRYELGYVDSNDANEICRNSAVGRRCFARITDVNQNINKDGIPTLYYEIICAETNAVGFEALQ